MTSSGTSRDRSPSEYCRRMWLAAAIALGVHLGIYFTNRPAVYVAAEFADGEPVETMDVELVEQAPEPVAVEPPPAAPVEPEQPAPTPLPEPTVPEPTIPEPMPEDVAPKEPPPKPEPKPRPVERPTRPVEKKAAPNKATPSRPAPAAAKSGTGPASSPTTGSKSGQGGVTSKPVAIYSPTPIYPRESEAAGEKGTVIIAVTVDKTGRIAASIMKSSGFPRLDRAALESMRRYRLKPALRNGQPVDYSFEKPFRFTR